MIAKPYFYLFILFLPSIIIAQNGIPFSTSKQFYLKGNSKLIGNNIVSTNAKKPNNSERAFNDLLNLRYIDIDNNKRTFSSSRANLQLKQDQKIKYAGLYWSAIYKYDKGQKKKRRNQLVYVGNNERSDSIQHILFKTPTQDYTALTGNIIFDSHGTDLFKTNSPYLCYADVTTILQNAPERNGDYTVANINATQGYISGGASGGWLLYVIYESDNDTPKYFTTYNGFIEVSEDKPALIEFTDFKTAKRGNVNAVINLAALEGDNKFKTDQLAFLNSKNNKPFFLSTTLRPKNNFFNGKITRYNALNKARTPASSNTFGFDLVKMKLPNKNNLLLANNDNKASITLKTKLDRFYLFFVAFETEINEEFFIKKIEEKAINLSSTENLNFENRRIKEFVAKPADLATQTKAGSIKSEPITKVKEVIKNNEVKTKTNQHNTTTERTTSVAPADNKTIKKGYYLISNVFSTLENTNKWMSFITGQGFNPNYFINPENGWFYVYLSHEASPFPIRKRHKELKETSYLKDLWVFKF